MLLLTGKLGSTFDASGGASNFCLTHEVMVSMDKLIKTIAENIIFFMFKGYDFLCNCLC
jgi:hypothetical protein